MSKNAQSPEPWAIGDREPGTVTNCNQNHVIHRMAHRGVEFGQDDLRRIVACVNFCRGLDTRKLEAAVLRCPPDRIPLDATCGLKDITDFDSLRKGVGLPPLPGAES